MRRVGSESKSVRGRQGQHPRRDEGTLGAGQRGEGQGEVTSQAASVSWRPSLERRRSAHMRQAHVDAIRQANAVEWIGLTFYCSQ